VETAGVVPLKDGRGEGAGIRISGARPQSSYLAGRAGKELQFDFEVVSGGQEVELVCELRSSEGEAKFDLGSLSLERL
jgi:hypothetical protein